MEELSFSSRTSQREDRSSNPGDDERRRESKRDYGARSGTKEEDAGGGREVQEQRERARRSTRLGTK
jgi:hypothetical protein